MLDLNLNVSEVIKDVLHSVAQGCRRLLSSVHNRVLESRADAGDSSALRERLARSAASKAGSSMH